MPASAPYPPSTTHQFAGFERPSANWFRMPHNWTDITAGINNIAELKVVEYILRHTWGYQEYGVRKHITVDEFVRGRRRQDGSRMDKGTGLSERAVRYGLQKALAEGLIEEEIDDRDRGRIKKYYSLRMRHEAVGEQESPSVEAEVQDLPAGVQTLHPHLQTLPPRGAGFAPRTEKETSERYSSSKIEREQRKEGVATRPVVPTQAVADRSPAGFTRIAMTLPNRPPPAPGPGDDLQIIQAYLRDIAQVFHDRASLRASTTRALRLMQRAGSSREVFLSRLHEARSLTKESVLSSPAPIRNQMAFFFSVLADRLGLSTDPELAGSSVTSSATAPSALHVRPQDVPNVALGP